MSENLQTRESEPFKALWPVVMPPASVEQLAEHLLAFSRDVEETKADPRPAPLGYEKVDLRVVRIDSVRVLTSTEGLEGHFAQHVAGALADGRWLAVLLIEGQAIEKADA